MPRLAMGAASLSIVWSAWRLGHRHSPFAGLLAGFVAATWFEFLDLGVQTLCRTGRDRRLAARCRARHRRSPEPARCGDRRITANVGGADATALCTGRRHARPRRMVAVADRARRLEPLGRIDCWRAGERYRGRRYRHGERRSPPSPGSSRTSARTSSAVSRRGTACRRR